MDSSTVGAPLPNRRPESRRGSESRRSEHLDDTIRFPPIDPFRVNPFSELRDDHSLALLVGGSDATRFFVTRQARSGPSSLTTLLPPPPHRNSRPTVPPSPHADRSPTPPRDRAVSPAADRMGSAFELAVLQFADRFAAQSGAQAAALSEMREIVEGLHHERGLRSTALNVEDTATTSAISSSTPHVAPRPIDSSRHDPNVLAAPSTAY